MIGGQPAFFLEMLNELDWIRGLLPHLGEERGAPVSLLDGQSIDIGSEPGSAGQSRSRTSSPRVHLESNATREVREFVGRNRSEPAILEGR